MQVRPLSNENCVGLKSQLENYDRWRKIGLAAIKNGKAAILILAGGQATRLGSGCPKGMFKLELPEESGCQCLFDVQAKGIEQRQLEAGGALVHWYVMLSEATELETIKYFEDQKYWGLQKSQIHFFLQSDLPALSLEDEPLFDQKGDEIRSPAGNGAVFQALHQEGILREMEALDIKWICQYGVDNILAEIADPIALGCTIEKNVDILCKSILKSRIDEPVGQVVEQWSPEEKKWKILVIEYSEMASEIRDELFKADYPGGHVCMNIFKTNFLSKLSHEYLELPKHRALKKIPHSKDLVPDKPNGYKFEMFIFDIFPFTKNFLLFQVDRDFEFAPLKNSDDSSPFDNPMECVQRYKLKFSK